VMEETAQGLVRRYMPSLTEDQVMKAIAWSSHHYLSEGVTTTVIETGSAKLLYQLQQARRQDLVHLRIDQMFNGFANDTAPSPVEKAGVLNNFGNDWLKIVASGETPADGSIQGYTGYLSKPYYVPFHGDTTYRGYPRYPQAQLTAMVTRLYCEGYQIAIHGNGDAAIDEILNSYAAAEDKCPRTDARLRIEHAQMARQDQLERMKTLGVTPSFFVGHVYYWGDRHRDIFMGPERAARISPLESAHKLGIRFTIHQDTPVTPVNPIHLIWVAVNRLTRSGKVLGPDERVTPELALRAVTIDAAWQNFDEHRRGSLEPGKLADFVVLSGDPLTVQPTTIKDIKVLKTVVGGQVAFDTTAAPAGQ
jgi:predicted amidohydrolase YtcJ